MELNLGALLDTAPYEFPPAVYKGKSGWLDSGVMGVLSKGFSPTGRGRGFLQPQIFGLPRHVRAFPFTAGVWAETGESLALTVAAGRTFVSVSEFHLI